MLTLELDFKCSNWHFTVVLRSTWDVIRDSLEEPRVPESVVSERTALYQASLLNSLQHNPHMLKTFKAVIRALFPVALVCTSRLWLIDLLIDLPIDLLIDLPIYLPIDLLIDLLIYWMIDLLNDWFTEWLIYWYIY